MEDGTGYSLWVRDVSGTQREMQGAERSTPQPSDAQFFIKDHVGTVTKAAGRIAPVAFAVGRDPPCSAWEPEDASRGSSLGLRPA